MLSKELKNLISRFGTVIVIENDVPKFVVMTYDKFDGVIHKNVDNSGNIAQDSGEEMADRLNKEILALKEQVAEKEREVGNL